MCYNRAYDCGKFENPIFTVSYMEIDFLFGCSSRGLSWSIVRHASLFCDASALLMWRPLMQLRSHHPGHLPRPVHLMNNWKRSVAVTTFLSLSYNQVPSFAYRLCSQLIKFPLKFTQHLMYFYLESYAWMHKSPFFHSRQWNCG